MNEQEKRWRDDLLRAGQELAFARSLRDEEVLSDAQRSALRYLWYARCYPKIVIKSARGTRRGG